MTIEEKARAYDEALERARALNNGKDIDVEAGTTICEYIFPEIKENESERIKKELLDYFQAYKEQKGCGVTTFYGIPTDNILAWLKKQGHMLDPDKVIAWLNDQACQGWIEDVEVDKFIAKFKEDFKL